MATDLVDVEEHLFCLPLFCDEGPLHEQQHHLQQPPSPPAAMATAAPATAEAISAAAAQTTAAATATEAAAAAVAKAEAAAAGVEKGSEEEREEPSLPRCGREEKEAAAEGQLTVVAAAAAIVAGAGGRTVNRQHAEQRTAHAADGRAEERHASTAAAVAAAYSSTTISADTSCSLPSLLPLFSSSSSSSSSSQQQHCGGPLSKWRENVQKLRLLFPSALCLLKNLNEAWDDYEEWAAMACEALDCLDFRIHQERDACDRRWPHTPNLFDAAKLQFRNFCLLHSQLMRSVCLSLYALIHEVEELSSSNSSNNSCCCCSSSSFFSCREMQQDALETREQLQEPHGHSTAVDVSAARGDDVQSQEGSCSTRANDSFRGERKKRRILSRTAAYKVFQVFENFFNQLEALDVMDDGLCSMSTRERFRTFLLTPARETSSRVFSNYDWI